MKHIESLAVKYHQEKVGTLSLSADGKYAPSSMPISG